MINLNKPQALSLASQFGIGVGSAALLSYLARMFPQLIYIPVVAGGAFVVWWFYKFLQLNRGFKELASRLNDPQAYAELLLQKEEYQGYFIALLVAVLLGVAIALINPAFLPVKTINAVLKFVALGVLAIAWAIVSLFLFRLWHIVPPDKAKVYPILFLIESILIAVAGAWIYGV